MSVNSDSIAARIAQAEPLRESWRQWNPQREAAKKLEQLVLSGTITLEVGEVSSNIGVIVTHDACIFAAVLLFLLRTRSPPVRPMTCACTRLPTPLPHSSSGHDRRASRPSVGADPGQHPPRGVAPSRVVPARGHLQVAGPEGSRSVQPNGQQAVRVPHRAGTCIDHGVMYVL